MRSAQLARLEGLSEKRADKSRDSVDRSRHRLAQMDQHRSELQSITREYQAEPEGGVMFTSKLLAHRREFVAHLTEKIEALSVQRHQQKQLLEEQEVELRDRTAQSAAIAALHHTQLQAEMQAATKREQQQQDEAYRGVVKRDNTDSEDSGDE